MSHNSTAGDAARGVLVASGVHPVSSGVIENLTSRAVPGRIGRDWPLDRCHG